MNLTADQKTGMANAPPDKSIAHCDPAIQTSRVEVTQQDLPVSCPLPEECLVFAHPRVYLAFDQHGRARCPYCSREFVLVEGKK